MVNLLFNAEEDVRVLAASVLGVCLTFADDAVFDSIVRTTILTTSLAELSSEEQHGRCVALGQLLKYNGERSVPYHTEIIHNVTLYLKTDNLMIRKSAISVCKYVLNSYNMMTEENKGGAEGVRDG